MKEKFEQLRFDISEKIRLHPQQAGIDSLLELDLYPDVEILDEGEHLKIQGYLRLSGSYLIQDSEEEQETDKLTEEIAYVIPVEITLPRDRAEMEKISAEVETFDYQVLSPFELQIEAVLLIDGILSEPEKEEEGVLAAHEEEETSFRASPIKEIEVEEPIVEIVEENSGMDNTEETQNLAVEEVEGIDEEESEIDLEKDEDPEAEAKKTGWSSWLIREQGESLTPLKMVIVQKEDTIDTLAAKYEVSANQIISLNQLTTDRLQEGQILRIPTEGRA